jgi:hypothetical protein
MCFKNDCPWNDISCFCSFTWGEHDRLFLNYRMLKSFTGGLNYRVLKSFTEGLNYRVLKFYWRAELQGVKGFYWRAPLGCNRAFTVFMSQSDHFSAWVRETIFVSSYVRKNLLALHPPCFPHVPAVVTWPQPNALHFRLSFTFHTHKIV